MGELLIEEVELKQEFKNIPTKFCIGCKICSVEFTDLIENRESCLCVDHDHTCCAFSKGSCGKCIRGFLCFSCNQGLGNFKDNKELLIKASKYLETACA